jgi:hypothetical protein
VNRSEQLQHRSDEGWSLSMPQSLEIVLILIVVLSDWKPATYSRRNDKTGSIAGFAFWNSVEDILKFSSVPSLTVDSQG